MLKTYWKTLAVLLVLTLLWRIPADGTFFHGLEYEDSYIYTVAGRQMAEHVGPASIALDSSYSINACKVGSLKACQQWEPFPEHLIGYPYVVSVVSRALGYAPSVGSFVNLFASCITTLLVFCIALLISDDPNVAFLGGIMFAIVPVFAVYGLETSAEPFSNVCIALVVWLYLRLCDADQLRRRDQVGTWIAYSAALLFAQTIKREDILLAAVMPIMLPFMLQAERPGSRARYTVGALVIMTSALAVILSVKMHLLQTSSNEAELALQFPMTPRHLAAFVTGFLRSFSVSEWYGGTVFAVVAGAIVACRRRGRALLPLVLLVAYILLYASHIRSYYEMKSGVVEPLAALRFSMNFMALWAIVAGLGIGSIATSISKGRIWNRYQRLSTWCVGTLAATTLVVAFIATVRLREYAIEDEKISRLAPAEGALHFASHVGGQSDFIVTMEPLVVQMYADSATRIVDLESVDSNDLQALIYTGGGSHLIFLEEADRLSDDDMSRYGEQIRYLLSIPHGTLQSDSRFQILTVGSGDSR